MAPGQQRWKFLTLPVLLIACIAAASSTETHRATILRVRKVLKNPTYVSTRYLQIHYYSLFFSVRVSGQRYCAEYTTSLTNEIGEINSAMGKEIETVVKGKKINLQMLDRRTIKAHLVNEKRCAAAATAE